MKLGLRARRASTLVWLLLFAVYAVAAVGVTVFDAMDDGYDELSQVTLVTVHASEDMRRLGATQMAAVFRARSGAPFTSLPPGSTVKVVWPDGSSEYVVVVNPAASDGMRSIPGTRRDVEGRELAEPGALDETGQTQLPARLKADRDSVPQPQGR